MSGGRMPARATALAVALALVALPAGAQTAAPDAPVLREDGVQERDLLEDHDGSKLAPEASPPRGSASARGGIGIQSFSTASEPDENGLIDGRLPEREPEPDASTARGLIPFHEIAPRLNVHADNERVTLAVRGHSVQGRELIYVELTAPESPSEAAEQLTLRETLRTDPLGLAADPASFSAAYKPYLFINNNIHGNEWEGTDASLDLIDYLATADPSDPATEGGDPADGTVGELLDGFRVVFLATANPDGRVSGSRQNANAIDMNRDHVTQSQPETRVMRDVMVETMPLLMLDQHGYVCPTLIEPGTPPHGRDYEYDLYIKWALPHAEAMEAEVLGNAEYRDLLTDSRVSNNCRPVQLGGGNERLRIPFRDNDEGWDDWPPIFTPMYAIYHGAIAHTIEFPINPRTNNASNNTFFAQINTLVARSTIDAMLGFAIENSAELQADQIEAFRRQAAGEPSVNGDIPDGFVPGFGPEDRWPSEFPEGYVLPWGEGQASDSAALNLAQHLLDNGIEVTRLTEAATIDGTTYGPGSFVVDMAQPRRGLASVMLSDGEDVSPRVGRMYDISGWSHGRVWGATVTATEARSDVDAIVGDAYGWQDTLDTSGTVELPAAGETATAAYALRIDSTEAFRAVLELQDAGHVTQRAADSTVLIAPYIDGTTETAIPDVADTYGLTFTLLDELPEDRTVLPRPRFAASVFSDEDGAFESLGFTVASYTSPDAADADVVLVNTTALTQWVNGTEGGFDLDEFDALHVSNTTFNATVRGGLAGYLDGGGGLSLQAGSRSIAVTQLGRLPGSTVQDHPSASNGVAKTTTTAEGNRVIFDYGVDDHAFVNFPATFSAIDLEQPGLHVEQRFTDDGTDRVLLNGFWANQSGLQGRPIAVSLDEPDGGRIAINLTEPFYREHPRGQYRHVVNALLWAADYDATDADIRAEVAGPPVPLTPFEVAFELIDGFVEDGDIPARRGQLLTDRLERARSFAEGGNVSAARGQLTSFVALLNNPQVSREAADALRAQVEVIRASL